MITRIGDNSHRWDVESEGFKVLPVSTASAANRAILPTLFMLCLRPLLMYILNPGGGAVSMDMSNIVVEVEEDTKDCFVTPVVARAPVPVPVVVELPGEETVEKGIGIGIGMDSVLLRGMECPPIVTDVFLTSSAAFNPAAPKMILAVFAAAVTCSYIHSYIQLFVSCHFILISLNYVK